MPAPDTISTLGPTASFYQWFQSYNGSTGALAKLNKMYIYDAKAGDGITLQSSTTTGGYTFAISSEINKGITFNGAVRFNSTVTFPTGTQISSASRVFTGNFLPGACLGSVVRVLSNGGITRAQADDRTNAEAVGIVTSINGSSATVTVVGEISGTSLTNNLLGSGVFSTGCVYFLSPSSAGRVTTTEPTSSGQVSKPILIATSATGGIVLPFRGQYIDLVGVSGACGEGLDTIVIPIISEGETEANFKLRPGSVMAVSLVEYTDDYRSTASVLRYRKANSQTPIGELIGIVSSYVGSYSTTSGDNVYLLVQPVGSVVDFDDLGWSPDVRDTGYIYLDSSGNPTKNISSDYSYSIGTSVQGSFIFAPAPITTPPGILLGSGSAKGSKNYFINGSLLLWQRKGRGDISGVTWTSGSTGDYFADRWCVINTYPSGQTFEIVRKDFAKNETAVVGYPQHYFNFSGITRGASNTFYIENRTEDARTNAGKEMTLSFYAKASTSQDVVPYVKQYKNVLDTPSHVYGSTLTISSSAWTRYHRTITVPVPTGQTFDTEGYFAAGLKMASANINIDFAQFMLDEGRTYSTPDMVDLNEEYKKSAYYYQRSYAPKDPTGVRTKWERVETGNQNFYSLSNTPYVTVLPNTTDHIVYLPTRMRPSSMFTGLTAFDLPIKNGSNYKVATIYSPLDGVTNDAYNITSRSNLRNTQGSLSQNFVNLAYGLGVEQSVIRSGFPAFFTTRNCLNCDLPTTSVIAAYPIPNVDGSISSLSVDLLSGIVLLDQVAFNYVVDLDLYQGLT